jgi:uncharacterized protein (DUF433 family)
MPTFRALLDSASVETTSLRGARPIHDAPGTKLAAFEEPAMKSPRVISDPEILGGTPVFIGTRVPVRILFEHLEAGDSLDVFLDDFPSVSRELAVQVLEDAKAALVVDAHPA